MQRIRSILDASSHIFCTHCSRRQSERVQQSCRCIFNEVTLSTERKQPVFGAFAATGTPLNKLTRFIRFSGDTYCH